MKLRAALIAAYRDASPVDRIALVQAIGPTEMFDTAIAPALGIAKPTITTTKSNGKAGNGNGHDRPVAPPVTVDVTTH